MEIPPQKSWNSSLGRNFSQVRKRWSSPSACPYNKVSFLLNRSLPELLYAHTINARDQVNKQLAIRAASATILPSLCEKGPDWQLDKCEKFGLIIPVNDRSLWKALLGRRLLTDGVNRDLGRNEEVLNAEGIVTSEHDRIWPKQSCQIYEFCVGLETCIFTSSIKSTIAVYIGSFYTEEHGSMSGSWHSYITMTRTTLRAMKNSTAFEIFNKFFGKGVIGKWSILAKCVKGSCCGVEDMPYTSQWLFNVTNCLELRHFRTGKC